MLTPSQLPAIRNDDQNLFNLISTVVDSINQTGINAGIDPRPSTQTDPAKAIPSPAPPTGLAGTVSGKIVLIEMTPGAGALESALYFVEVATVATFPSVRTFRLGHSTHLVIPLVAGTYYFRAYSKYQMSGSSVYSLPITLVIV